MTKALHLVLLIAALALAAPAFAGQPPKPERQTDPACTWVWTTGAGMGLWTEDCPFDTGRWQVRAEAEGFALWRDEERQAMVLQRFALADGAPIAALLPELRRRGLIVDTDDCVFQPAAISPAPRTIAQFEIRPVGETLKAFEATPEDMVPDPPCGDYGWSTHGVRYFQTDLTKPGAAYYIDLGQDGTMIAPETLVVE